MQMETILNTASFDMETLVRFKANVNALPQTVHTGLYLLGSPRWSSLTQVKSLGHS